MTLAPDMDASDQRRPTDGPAGDARAPLQGGIAGASWAHVPIRRIEDLSDAVYDAGVDAVQFSPRLGGSLVFGDEDGVLCTSGWVRGRVALRGPLSETMITLAAGLRIPKGCRQWLTEIETGAAAAFLPGDEHEALYPTDSLYVAVTLPFEDLEARTARLGMVLEPRHVGGTGMHPHRLPAARIAPFTSAFDLMHENAAGSPPKGLAIRTLDMLIEHFSRAPRPAGGAMSLRLRARIVRRAREYIVAHLAQPIAIDDVAAAAFTSRRTLHRAFREVLDESPQSYVRTLRLHRVRKDLASVQERACTVSMIANRWGLAEPGRTAGWYRKLFGELPSETLARGATPDRAQLPERPRRGDPSRDRKGNLAGSA